MTSSYLHGRVHELVEQLERRGIDAVDPIGRKRLAYFFVRGASARKFTLSDNDDETLRRFVAYCRQLIASDGGPELIADHKSGLRIDAKIIRDSREPVGALILYATWLEHWVNGTIIVAAEHAGLEPSRARRIVRESNFLPKFRDRLPELRLPPLPPEVLDWIAEVNALRNDYLHYKWYGEAAAWGQPHNRLSRVLEDVDDRLRALVAYAVANLFEPAITEAERLLQVEYREWMPLFV